MTKWLTTSAIFREFQSKVIWSKIHLSYAKITREEFHGQKEADKVKDSRKHSPLYHMSFSTTLSWSHSDVKSHFEQPRKQYKCWFICNTYMKDYSYSQFNLFLSNVTDFSRKNVILVNSIHDDCRNQWLSPSLVTNK